VKRRLAIKGAVFAAVLLLACAHALHGAGPSAQWLGVLWTKGSVSVGDAQVSSGTTILPGDVIKTAPGATAWLRFRSQASTILLADTQLTILTGSVAPSLLLNQGTAIVDVSLADPIRIAVPGGEVLVRGDPQAGAECEMATVENGVTVSVKRGLAEIRRQGAPVLLRAGQSARLDAGPQGGQPIAGKITRIMPKGVIKRPGLIQELPLSLNAVVDWNDLVRTLDTGRAQIMLVDGSTLNVGVRSQITILRHEATKQQTEIRLSLGTVQANVERITTPGGKFELQTTSAVIGTIDTSYVATTNDGTTRVCGVSGTTSVRSSDPSITKTVRLHRNECVVVILGQAPSDPQVNPAEMALLLAETGLQAGLSPAATEALALGAAATVGAIIAGVVLYNSGTTTPTTP
jgi:ferric-dicitrate binding protein FerR (iron transport regulator)